MDKQAAVVLVLRGREALVVSNKNFGGRFSLPGGKVEPGESFQQAAVRELLEETGLRVLEPHYLALIYQHASSIEPDRLVSVFHAPRGAFEPMPDVLGQARAMEPGTEVRWVPIEDLLTDACAYPGFYRHMLVKMGLVPDGRPLPFTAEELFVMGSILEGVLRVYRDTCRRPTRVVVHPDTLPGVDEIQGIRVERAPWMDRNKAAVLVDA